MSKDDLTGFSLSDIRAIRYLMLAGGAIAIGMLLITDRETPLLVIGFVTVVMAVPLVAIYLLRRFGKRKEPGKAPPPTPPEGR